MSTRTSCSTIRNVEMRDYERVMAVIDQWWGGRILNTHLSRVIFGHFRPTSFVAECDDELVAFLLGFLSQTYPGEAYVHLVGVRPDARRLGLATTLYKRFFVAAHNQFCSTVRAATSPTNSASIAFHAALGFRVEPGDEEVGGVSVRSNHPALGESRVSFVRPIVGGWRETAVVDGQDRLAS